MTFYVGLIGQSNIGRLESQVDSPPSVDSRVKEWNGSVYQDPTANGHIVLGNALAVYLNDDIRLINVAVGGSALTAQAGDADYWSLSSGAIYTALGRLEDKGLVSRYEGVRGERT